MKNKNLILTLTIIVSVLSAYFLSFSWISKGVEDDAAAYATNKSGQVDPGKKQMYLDSVWKEPVFNMLGIDYTYQEIKEQELHLGLDLQGGMHVTLEVSPVEIIKAMANQNQDPALNNAIKKAVELQKTDKSKFTKLFYNAFREEKPDVKLANYFANTVTKDRIKYSASNEEILKVLDDEIESAIDRSFNILRNRIDKFGVVQPNIQRLKGTGRIQLELPGVENPTRVRKLLQGSANLDFWEVYNVDEYGSSLEKMNNLLVAREKMGTTVATETTATSDSATSTAANDLEKQLAGNTAKKDSASKDTSAAKQGSLFSKLFVQTYGGLGVRVKDTAKVNRLMADPAIASLFPSQLEFHWAAKPEDKNSKEEILDFYALKKSRTGKPALEGKVVTDARIDFQSGTPSVSMQMSAEGARKWKTLTRENTGRRLAIVMDGLVLSAPNVQGEIPNGSSNITGNFDINEAKDLANMLKSGRMPAPTQIVEEAIVGPSLGREAIDQGLTSSMVGVIAVIIFMIAYYAKGGFIADIALAFNIFFLIGVMVQMGAVMTLPGIAGIVLTMGMSVDANVLIFERIREEISSGKSIAQSIDLGYKKAFLSIFDSNVTTLLTGVILAVLGTGPVQGFAVTLIIGIFTSFFTAVYVSRFFIEWMLKGKEGKADAMSFSTVISRGMFKNTHFDFVGNRKKAYIFSAVIIVIGFSIAFAKGGFTLGVDFKGGRSYVVQFDKAVAASDVKTALAGSFEGTGSEVKTYGSADKLKITTSYLSEDDSEGSDAKVLTALNGGLTKFAAEHPKVLSSSKVGATIADDIKTKSFLAIFFSLTVIFGYVLLRFQDPKFSMGAVLALFHDVLAALALISIVSLIGLTYEIDQVMIAALLTLVGYSVNDTVVVFDRIREVMKANPNGDIAKIINQALNETLSRTIITASTVFLVLIILFIFGGEVLSGFSFALLAGLFFGSYSSVYIAAPVILDLKFKKKDIPAEKAVVEVIK